MLDACLNQVHCCGAVTRVHKELDPRNWEGIISILIVSLAGNCWVWKPCSEARSRAIECVLHGVVDRAGYHNTEAHIEWRDVCVHSESGARSCPGFRYDLYLHANLQLEAGAEAPALVTYLRAPDGIGGLINPRPAPASFTGSDAASGALPSSRLIASYALPGALRMELASGMSSSRLAFSKLA